MQTRNSLLLVACALLLLACGSPGNRAADYLEKAQKYYAAGDFVKARLEAQNAAQVAPKNAEALYLLALVAEQEKDYKTMFGHLLATVSADPANVEARVKLGTIYTNNRSSDEAAKEAAALLKLAPKDARSHLLQSLVLFQQGNRPGALAQLDTALKLDPDNVDAILLQSTVEAYSSAAKGVATLDAAIERLPPDKARLLREERVELLLKDKRPGAAEAGLRALAADFSEKQGYASQLAQFLVSQGRVDEADQLLKTRTEVDPKDADAQLGYVRFLVGQRGPEKAEVALKAFIEQNPDAGKLRLALGQLYEISNRADEARDAYAALGDRASKSTEGLAARNRLVALDTRAGKLDVARNRVDSILKDAPDDASALLLRAGLWIADGKFDDAIGDLRLVLRTSPDNDTALLLLAQTYLRKNDEGLAKDTYRQLLAVAPDSPDGLVQLAVIYAAEKDYAESEVLLRQRIAKQPDDLAASGRLVEVLLAQGKVAGAEDVARRMVAPANQVGAGDFSLGQVLAQKKDYGAAADAFRRSMAARPGDALALEGLVRSLLAGGQQAEAKSVLVQQLDNSENRLVARFLLGGIYASEGDQAKAEAYLGEVLKENPESVPAWKLLAGAYNNPEDRISVLQRANKAVPGTVELQMRLAIAFLDGGRSEDAITVYESLLKADPKSEDTINNLAALLLDERTDKASHARALKLAEGLANSKNPALLDTLGWAYYRTGKYPEAVGVLERVVAKAGKVSQFRYHLGMAYLRAGNAVGAKQQLVEAVGKAKGDYPGLAEARATLEKLNKPS